MSLRDRYIKIFHHTEQKQTKKIKRKALDEIQKHSYHRLHVTLLRSSILCLHGARSMRRRLAGEASIGTLVEEGRLLS